MNRYLVELVKVGKYNSVLCKAREELLAHLPAAVLLQNPRPLGTHGKVRLGGQEQSSLLLLLLFAETLSVVVDKVTVGHIYKLFSVHPVVTGILGINITLEIRKGALRQRSNSGAGDLINTWLRLDLPLSLGA